MKFLARALGRGTKDELAQELQGVAENITVDMDPLDISDVADATAWPEPELAVAPAPPQDVEPVTRDVSAAEIAAVADNEVIDAALEVAGAAQSGAVNIWDIDDGDDDADSFQDDVTIAPAFTAPAPKRAEQEHTRTVAAQQSDGTGTAPSEDTQKVVSTNRVEFPVGWLLVVDGPGRGNCFALVAGMSQIGRGEDQFVSLNFGDMTISRNNHAAIVYDADTRQFILGHGGKANVVRLNGQPVISNESLTDGDRIKIGNTTLQLKTLCGDQFDWSEHEVAVEREDVAIA